VIVTVSPGMHTREPSSGVGVATTTWVGEGEIGGMVGRAWVVGVAKMLPEDGVGASVVVGVAVVLDHVGTVAVLVVTVVATSVVAVVVVPG
jgi:hypothetical protein